MRKLKIAIFTDTFLPQINGVVTATINLSKELANKGHKVYIIAPEFKNSKKFLHKNIEVIRINSIPAYFYEDFKLTYPFSKKIFDLVKKEKIEILHFQTPMPLGLQAIIISKILKLPLVGTFHTFFGDPQYLKHVKMNFRLIEKISWIYARAYYNRCDLITSPSKTTKKEMIKNGIRNKIKVISNGIDFRLFKDKQKARIKKVNSPNGDKILFIGRIAHEKNIIYLLECFKKVAEKLPQTKLLVVGGGPQEKEVKEKIESLNLEKNVVLMGKIPHEKLVKSPVFKKCKLFVTASKTENQPMTILEAQANGLVCVGINARGMKDLIKNDYNGYLVSDDNKVDFASKIIKLLGDKKEYERMKKNTLNEIKKHSLEKIGKKWEEEYNKLIKNA